MSLPAKDTQRVSEIMDIVIVGAGISGINVAYRLQTELPDINFTILESRDEIGGTWDLFRYPGARSDSDMYTYSFAWRPFPFPDPIGQGPLILQYLKDCVSQHGIDKFIRFRHKVLSANWSQDSQQWTVITKHNDLLVETTASFLILGTGYYDYNTPLQVVIPGLEQFKGKVIHPQFWPVDYEHQNKKIAIIGSGATCVSLFPSLAETATHVTIVQRSPSYIVSLPNKAPHSVLSILSLSPSLFICCNRIWSMLNTHMQLLLCKYCPVRAREFLRILTAPQLPKGFDYDHHFQPRYNVWEQRLCLSPDGDFFQALRQPNTSLVTEHIDKVTENSIRMQDGTIIDVDAIVTATGLTMKFGGDISISVDGKELKWEDKVIWKGAMLDGIPNMMFMLGYTNFAWTLGADNTAHILIRLLKFMKSKGFRSAVPQLPQEGVFETQKMWQLSSTYANKALSHLPRYGMKGPWKPKVHALLDYVYSRWGNVTGGLRFTA
ncbi:FAD/NAD(P)-binding domain-containing protein [Jackrogersella minutella]|nr:FAD/NAD(P)-binding domain-containing protein [Jackrogersella minutella]